MAERVMLSLKENPKEFAQAWNVAKLAAGVDSKKQSLVNQVFGDGEVSATEYLLLDRDIFQRNQSHNVYPNRTFISRDMEGFMEQFTSKYMRKDGKMSRWATEPEIVNQDSLYLCAFLYSATQKDPIKVSADGLFGKLAHAMYKYFQHSGQPDAAEKISGILQDGSIEQDEIADIDVCNLVSDE